jgi:hypothetical protein
MVNRKGEIPLQKRIELTNWIVLGTLLFLSGAFASASFIIGVLIGGLISVLNFYGLCRGLQTAFEQLENGGLGKSKVMFKYLLRLVLTGLVLYLVLAKTTVNIFGLVIGLSTVAFNIILSVIMTLFNRSYLKEV